MMQCGHIVQIGHCNIATSWTACKYMGEMLDAAVIMHSHRTWTVISEAIVML